MQEKFQLLSRTATCFLLVMLLTMFSAQAQLPKIFSFTPAAGPVGSIVTINGKNFSSNTARDEVYFGAVRSSVVTASKTALQVIVPDGATFQPITVSVNHLISYSSVPFITTFSSSNALIDSNAFGYPVLIYQLGTGEISGMLGADFDNDGKTDIVVSHTGTGFIKDTTVSILRNNSTNNQLSFDSSVDFVVKEAPYGMAACDLNGDKKMDLIICTFDSICVLLNNSTSAGNISFKSPLFFTTKGGDQSVSVRDFDGDGKPDIAVTLGGVPALGVLINTSTDSTVSFAPIVEFTSFYPSDLASADLDNDGLEDIIVACMDSLELFRNTSTRGHISFAPRISIKTGEGVFSCAAGDLDGDGRIDIINPNDFDGTVSILRNTSTPGNLSFEEKQNYPTGYGPIHVNIGDLNGDGKLDMAVANGSDSTISVYQNTSPAGEINFNGPVNFFGEYGPWPLEVCDFNGDGKTDIAGDANGDIFILPNNLSDVLLSSLTVFNVSAVNTNADLNWQTAAEANTDYFLVQRSTDGKNFTTIAKIKAAGNSSSLRNYSYTDINVAALDAKKIYYRLQEIDKDAKDIYSNIEAVSFLKDNSPFSISPNPARDYIDIVSSETVTGVLITISDVNGKTLYAIKQDFIKGQSLRIATLGFSSGTLFITVDAGTDRSRFKIIKE